jgi:methylenetetrahydrofolate dehydrogenase (NADP+) / methenyltetrahydrofolate cyclohydrolase
MILLSGEPIAEKILNEVSCDTKKLHANGITPTIAVVLVGDDPSSNLYVSLKEKVAKKVGIDFLLYRFDERVKQVETEQLLITLHLDETVHGIIVQLPLPEHLDADKICQFIDPDKDVDGLLPQSKFSPPAPQATIELMRFYDIKLNGARVGLFGKGRLVGQPLEKMFLNAGAKVTVFDTNSKNIASQSQQCDILISATGKSDTIKPEYVGKSQTLIDVGGAYDTKRNKTIGDISPHARTVARAVTPRIGGIGPVTVAVLMRNVLTAAKKS